MAGQSSIIATQSDLERALFDETAEPKAMKLQLLEEITGGFSHMRQIGTGGFATVYKGMLENGMVAIKNLDNTHMHDVEFLREVECLTMARHENVIRFLGYCSDIQEHPKRYEGKLVLAQSQQRLLCFEYAPKGNLHDYIKDASCGLDWRNRYRIIKGTVQGLHYLHQNNIVHLDLKPANILLDNNMVPKIADFGLSRRFEEEQSKIITSKIGGTTGYLAPEYYMGVIRRECDLYSLGAVITEILSGDRGYHPLESVLESWRNRLEISPGESTHLDQIRVCAEIGTECYQRNPSERPTTQQIIDRLNKTENMDGSMKIDLTRSLSLQENIYIRQASMGAYESHSDGIRSWSNDLPGTSLTESYPSEMNGNSRDAPGYESCDDDYESCDDDGHNDNDDAPPVSHQIAANLSEGQALSTEDILKRAELSESRRLKYRDLVIATGIFSEKNRIGEGGFSVVYKGVLKIHDRLQEEVAVKKIQRHSYAREDSVFLSELSVTSQTSHRNIVMLKGWCYQRIIWKADMFLVYELVPNGTLHDHLYQEMPAKTVLSWTTRYKIVKGIAAGICYLHHECKSYILHRDIKPAHILLDHDFNPKLAGFAISSLSTNHKNAIPPTVAAGTLAYIDPMCIKNGMVKFGRPSDVYSFGLVLLEIACTKKPGYPSERRDQVWEMYRASDPEKFLEDVADPKLCGVFNKRQMQQVVILGLLCSSPDDAQRPSMLDVMKVLDNDTRLLHKGIGIPNSKPHLKSS